MPNILEMRNITKIYPNGVVALKDVNFQVAEGEIHALMGENGAGKSTLMKVLFGQTPLDKGEILFQGEKVEVKNPQNALDLGIGMVSQHFMLIDELSVYENAILGQEPSKLGVINREAAIDLVKKIGTKYDLQVNPEELVGNLSVGQKQKVELLKVLIRGSRIIILDEPTAVLTPQETQELFKQLLILRNDGYTIIFITHKIREVMQICDSISVLRKGRYVGSMLKEEATPEAISRMMIGRDVELDFPKKTTKFGETVLSVKNVHVRNPEGTAVLKDIDLDLHEGEILGIAGVEGNGQTYLADAIFGLEPVESGSIVFLGNDINTLSVAERRQAGLGYIPEDRMETGLATGLSVLENLAADKITGIPKNRFGLINFSELRNKGTQIAQEYSIVADSVNSPAVALSGGNMQKIVVARELSSHPRVLIANQPTRGIDVGAQEFIWGQLVKYQEEGNAVVLISADLKELLELSDTIVVMLDGRIVAKLKNENLTEEMLGYYMLGVKNGEEREIR